MTKVVINECIEVDLHKLINGMPMAEVARQLGISPQNFNHYINRGRRMKLDFFKKFCKITNNEIQDILQNNKNRNSL